MKAKQLTLQEEFTKQHLEEKEEKKLKTLSVRLTGKELKELNLYLKELGEKEKMKITTSNFIRALISVVLENEKK